MLSCPWAAEGLLNAIGAGDRLIMRGFVSRFVEIEVVPLIRVISVVDDDILRSEFGAWRFRTWSLGSWKTAIVGVPQSISKLNQDSSLKSA